MTDALICQYTENGNAGTGIVDCFRITVAECTDEGRNHSVRPFGPDFGLLIQMGSQIFVGYPLADFSGCEHGAPRAVGSKPLAKRLVRSLEMVLGLHGLAEIQLAAAYHSG